MSVGGECLCVDVGRVRCGGGGGGGGESCGDEPRQVRRGGGVEGVEE